METRIVRNTDAGSFGFLKQIGRVLHVPHRPGNANFTYSKNKKEIEVIFASFIVDNPQLAVTILRPCFVVGPGFDNLLATHLKKKMVPWPALSAPMQFVH